MNLSNVLILNTYKCMNKKDLSSDVLTKKTSLNHFLLIMRTVIILLFTCVFVSIAETGYTQNAKVTLNKNKVALKEVLNEIENQTDYLFIYNNQVNTNKTVSVKTKKGTVRKVLNHVLKDSDIDYLMEGNHIILSYIEEKKKEEIKEIIEAVVQQGRTVTGKVTDINGESLPGVTVLIKGTSKGTITDVDGSFTLTDISESEILQLSFVGMVTQEIVIEDQTRFDITLTEDAIGLEEVVAIGYGTRKRAFNTASISSLGEEDLDLKSSTKNLGEMLQGKSAGVMVRNVGGSPDEEPVIRIRGMNSILGNNSALIIIDGLQRGNLRDLNPQDIKSMDILKGANATSIYGSEGANGVILITTKQGSIGKKPTVNFNSDISISNIDKKMPKINAAEWARYINARELADNLYREPQPIFTDSDIAEYEKTGGVDWQDVITQTGVSQNYNISIDGGSNSSIYRVSGSFLDKEGIVLTSDYNRYTLQAKINSDITDWLTIGLNWSSNIDVSNNVGVNQQTDNPIHAALSVPPLYPKYNEKGEYFKLADMQELKWNKYFTDPSIGNPLANAKEIDIVNKNSNNNIMGFLLFNPLEGLSLRMEFGVRYNNYLNQRFANNNTWEGAVSNGSGKVYQGSSKFFQNSNILNYEKTFGLHDLNITGIMEQKTNDYYSTAIENEDFPVHSTSFYDLGSAGVQRSSSGHNETKILSYVGRFSYNFNRRYLFSASYRADGSSVFGDKNKWSYFPSTSLGWKVSEEDFIANLDIFHNLMLRGSYGKTGNQSISPYQSLAKIGVTGRYPYYGGEGTILNYGITRAANPNLMWETTEQIDIGIDAAFFRGSLELTADYYKKVTRDLLQARELASYTGLKSITDNIGKLKNEGFEFSVNHTLVRNNFTMSNGFNISTNKTVILDLGPLDRVGYAAGGSGAGVNDPLIYLFEGERWGQIYAWNVEGTWNLEEEEEAKKYGQLPGDTKYTDLNGDYVIDTQDRMFVGNILPDFEYGFNSRITYKNLGASFVIQGVHGNKIFNVTRSNMIYSDQWNDRWTPENQDTDNPAIGYYDAKTREEKLKDNPNKISIPTAMWGAHSRWIEDGSYIRLKNITLSYNCPETILKRIGLQNLTFFVSGKNLITLTKFTGFNPEVSSFKNDKTLGTAFHDYPISREFTIGLSFTL